MNLNSLKEKKYSKPRNLCDGRHDKLLLTFYRRILLGVNISIVFSMIYVF